MFTLYSNMKTKYCSYTVLVPKGKLRNDSRNF